MKLSLTNVGKAKSVLQLAGFKNIGKDNPDSFYFGEEDIHELADTGQSKRLTAIDKAGRYLKEALLTTNTSHKKYDFSSIQATSSLNLQQFYSKIGNILDSDDNQAGSVDPSIQPQLDVLSKKIENEITKIQKLVEKDKALQAKLKEALTSNDKEECRKAILDDADFSTIDSNVLYVDQSNETYKESMRLKDYAKIPLVTIRVMTTAGAILGFKSVRKPLKHFGLIGLGVTALLAPVTTAAGAVIGLGVSPVIGAGLLISSLAEHFFLKGKVATRTAKSVANEMQDHQRKIIKYTNQSAAIVRKSKEKSKDITSTDGKMIECGQALDTFLLEQNDLWKHYATASNREYNGQSEEDSGKNKHKKISSLGKMKEWVAKTWSSANRLAESY